MSPLPPSSRPPSRPAAPPSKPAEARRPIARTRTGQMEKVKAGKAAQPGEDTESGAHGWSPGGDAASVPEPAAAVSPHHPDSAGDKPPPYADKRSVGRGDGFGKGDLKSMAHSSTSYSSLGAVGQLQRKLTGGAGREKLPQDAFALLREAKEGGVLFKEDSQREGHSEEQEDPELSAAVEECIRLCFGVRGILRIGPGHNDQHEPLVVVTVAQGFTESAFARVPANVHRFPTLVAIPFDLLPLRRDL